MRSSTRPNGSWVLPVLVVAATLTQGFAQDPGVQEFEYELQKAASGRHANFAQAVSLLETAVANDPENEELKTYLVRALVLEAQSLFKSGDLDASLLRLRDALSKQPSAGAASAALGDLDANVQLEMLVRGGDFSAAIRELDELRKEIGTHPTIGDTAVSAEAGDLAGELITAGAERRWEVQQELLRHGELSVQYLLPWLANERDTTARSVAMATLNRMRGDAVLPIIRALDSSSELQRLNVAIVLGTIGDPRALGALARASESTSETQRVKSAANEAIAQILGREGSAARAADYFWRKALDYYREKEEILRSYEDRRIVWTWDGALQGTGNVRGSDVLPSSYNERLAQQAIFDFLELNVDDAGRRAALSVLLATYLNEYVEAQTAATAAADMGAPDYEGIAQAATALDHAMALASAGGSELLGDTILRGVADGQGPMVMAAIDALEAIGGHVSALSPALTASDKRVRTRAAVAALRLNPSGRPFPSSEHVIPTLVDALGEVGARAVLVVEDETAVRNRVIAQLEEAGFNAFGAASGLAGLARATQYPRADVVLLSDSLPDIDPRTISARLQADYRSAGTVIAILSDPDKVGINDSDFVSNGLAARVLSKETNSALLANQLGLLLDKAAAMDSGRTAANKAAQSAAEALAALDPASTTYPVQQAVPGLLGSIERHTDEVRLPSLAALRKFGDGSAVRSVRAVLTSDQSSIAAKAAAARALGSIYGRVGRVSDEDVRELSKLLSARDTDPELRKAAGAALGAAPLTPAQRIALLTENRLH